ncbi:PepSY domain-containing protein [Thiohalobacter sp.]|uniref:PepSY domain-containing protein n=1 Tax=Thiohalobacter sp. TaxID=2025948 RepID=UPI00263308E2|nr:PepSY domain-containing protein [Thiohalobacter sp.]
MRRLLPLLLLAGLAMTGAAARADDHEAVRGLREAGAILPLAEILERLSLPPGSRVLEAELEREDGRLVYEIEVLGSDGRVREWQLDAASGTPIGPPAGED